MNSYTYNGKDYPVRTKSFKPYRLKSILFQKKYNEYEKQYTSELQSKIQEFLMTDKKAKASIMSASKTGDDSVNKTIVKILADNPSYAILAKEFADNKAMARELFIMTNEKGEVSDVNAKELCDIMLENSSDISHNPETEKEYEAYETFINQMWNDFFLNVKK